MKKLISDKKLPGTLNTQCVIPVAVMALTFEFSIMVSDPATPSLINKIILT
jgi:hypothetical protein